MKGFSLIKTILSTVLIVSCSNSIKSEPDEDGGSNLKQESSADQVQNGFWKDPNLNYISTEWPVDEDDLKIWDVPELEKAFIDTAPMNRNDGLVAGELGVDSGNKDIILKLAQEIADGQHDKIDSLLIAHKGKLIFESYYKRGRLNLTHPQASATKSYTGVALGRAIQLGYLTMADLDKPVISFLEGVDRTKLVKGAELVTLHQALTMRTGIHISKEQHENFEKYPSEIKGQKFVQAIFEHTTPITTETQSAFIYGNYSTPLVMQVIEAIVPGTAEDFIENELLGKMDIATYSWRIGLGGLPAAGWKSSITSRDMMKFGSLAMNKGKWNGVQLVPEAFMAKANSRLLYNGDDDIFGGGKDVSNQGYGYFMWSGDLHYDDKSYFSTSTQGGGGQYIILIEELDLIVVTTGHERHPSTLQLTAERILPAFIQ